MSRGFNRQLTVKRTCQVSTKLSAYLFSFNYRKYKIKFSDANNKKQRSTKSQAIPAKGQCVENFVPITKH